MVIKKKKKDWLSTLEEAIIRSKNFKFEQICQNNQKIISLKNETLILLILLKMAQKIGIIGLKKRGKSSLKELIFFFFNWHNLLSNLLLIKFKAASKISQLTYTKESSKNFNFFLCFKVFFFFWNF